MFSAQPIFGVNSCEGTDFRGRGIFRYRRTRSAARSVVVLIGFVISLLAFCHGSGAATIHVTSLADKVSGTGGCSLKEAIYSSTLHDTLDGVHGIAIDYTDPDHFIITECEIGTGNDTIILPTGYPLLLTTDNSWDAHNPYGPTATPIINSNITIQGAGATLLWAGAGHVRLFAVGPATIKTPNGVSTGTGSLTLVNVEVTGFSAKGGNGADGGGGGLGAGGAIYVQNGNLTIQDSTFDGNVATGGNGGAFSDGSGGGGGLGGSGGVGSQPGIAQYSNGGGGGGARGNGGSGAGGGGGGGGGTEIAGVVDPNVGGPGGYLCGGNGGDASDQGNNGHDGKCPGGGGGGAGMSTLTLDEFIAHAAGGNGAYGGGGGGGTDKGGSGGFGGGGGASYNQNGGNGGFGGGGGGSPSIALYGPGSGGAYGGAGSNGGGGGGGAALGGAIFSDSAVIIIENSTFANNSAFDGQGGANFFSPGIADDGGAAGAIFTRDGSLTIIDSTISGNQADGSGAGVVVYSDGSAVFILNDTILADNGANECYIAGTGTVTVGGAGNLIMSNGAGGSFNPCPGVVATSDPQLGPLRLNSPGDTPTMAISPTSSAFNTADPGTSLTIDQRGVERPQDGGFDIGSYEYCPPPRVFGGIPCPNTSIGPGQFEPLTMQVSPAGVGTTSPPLGINEETTGSVVVVTAGTSNPQYKFIAWSGTVSTYTDYTSPFTTLIVTEPLTAVANFAPCNCVIDASFYFKVTRGPIVLNPISKRYAETVTVTNTSSYTIFGPISLVLDSLSLGATLSNSSGSTDPAWAPAGSPYITVSGNLAPGKSASFILEFTPEGNGGISYATRVLAGPGAR